MHIEFELRDQLSSQYNHSLFDEPNSSKYPPSLQQGNMSQNSKINICEYTK